MKKTTEYAYIKNALSGGEHTRVIYTHNGKKYVKYYNKYVPLNKVRLITKMRKTKR